MGRCHAFALTVRASSVRARPRHWTQRPTAERRRSAQRGESTSTTRTADQTQMPSSGPTARQLHPGWTLEPIAQQIRAQPWQQSGRQRAPLRRARRGPAALDAAWDAKYTYGLWRPIDAIDNADVDNNAATTQQVGWTPLLLTPSHPEYVSGHSTYSMARPPSCPVCLATTRRLRSPRRRCWYHPQLHQFQPAPRKKPAAAAIYGGAFTTSSPTRRASNWAGMWPRRCCHRFDLSQDVTGPTSSRRIPPRRPMPT